MRGRPHAFSLNENEALRAAMRKLQAERRLSQAGVGQLLGIAQPAASRLLGTGAAGMARATANALARELGFRDVEDFLLDYRVSSAVDANVGAWGNRQSAIRIAASIGVDEAAVTSVVDQYRGDQHRSRPVKWWVRKMLEAETEMLADERYAAQRQRPR